MKISLEVRLNGTETSPFEPLGLTSNPFPQLGRGLLGDRRLAQLGGIPIPDTDYIRQHLKDYVSEELIDLCCRNYEKGRIVVFRVEWDTEG